MFPRLFGSLVWVCLVLALFGFLFAVFLVRESGVVEGRVFFGVVCFFVSGKGLFVCACYFLFCVVFVLVSGFSGVFCIVVGRLFSGGMVYFYWFFVVVLFVVLFGCFNCLSVFYGRFFYVFLVGRSVCLWRFVSLLRILSIFCSVFVDLVPFCCLS